MVAKRLSVFNSLKLRALSAFENRGWLDPPAWAAVVGFRPIRASYTYLLRLHRQRLLRRGRDARGLLLYRLSERGAERLVWLRRGPDLSQSRGIALGTVPKPLHSLLAPLRRPV